MKHVTTAMVLASLAGAGLFAAGSRLVSAAPQALLIPSPDKVRFRLVREEPIAFPDGRSILPGWRTIVFRDLDKGQCYLAFTRGDAMSMAGTTPCPE